MILCVEYLTYYTHPIVTPALYLIFWSSNCLREGIRVTWRLRHHLVPINYEAQRTGFPQICFAWSVSATHEQWGTFPLPCSGSRPTSGLAGQVSHKLSSVLMSWLTRWAACIHGVPLTQQHDLAQYSWKASAPQQLCYPIWLLLIKRSLMEITYTELILHVDANPN